MKKPVHVTHFYPEEPEAVFDACLDPQKIREWFMTNKDSKVISVDMNPVTGGTFSIIELTPDKRKVEHTGKYLYVSRPNWIVFTLEVPEYFEGPSEVSINVRKEKDGSLLVYHQSGVESDIGTHWKRKMTQLEKVLGV